MSLFDDLGYTQAWNNSGPSYNPQNYVASKPAPVQRGGVAQAAHIAATIGGAALGAIDHAATSAIGDTANYLNLFHQQNTLGARSQMQQQAMNKLFSMRNTMSKAQYGQSLRALTAHGEDLSKSYGSLVQAEKNKPSQSTYAGHVAELGSLALAAAAPFAAAPEAGSALAASRAGKIGQSVAEGIGGRPGALNSLSKATAGPMLRTTAAKGLQTALVAPFAGKTVKDVTSGNVPGALGDAALTAIPGVAGKVLPKIAGAANNALFDTSGMWDHVPVIDPKTGSVVPVTQALKSAEQMVSDGEMKQSQYRTIVNNLRVSQDQNMAEHGSPFRAAHSIIQHQQLHSNPTDTLTLQEFSRDQGGIARAGRKFQNMDLHLPNGEPIDASRGNITVGKVSFSDKAQVTKRLLQGFRPDGGPNSELAGTKADFPTFFKNGNNSKLVDAALAISKTPQDLKSALNELNASGQLFTKTAEGGLVPATHGGYHAVAADNPVAPFRTAREVPGIDYGNKAPLGKIGNVLSKSGLSPVGTDPLMERSHIIDGLNTRFAGTKFAGKGEDTLNGLNRLQSETRGVYDPRLLKINPNNLSAHAVTTALGVDSSEARFIMKSLKGAYTDIPLSIRGLGPRLTDTALKFPGMSTYLKAQGYGRFTANPAFWAKQDIKSSLIGAAHGAPINVGGFLNKMFGTAPSAETEAAMRANGDLSHNGVAGSAQDFVAGFIPHDVLDNVKSADLRPFQQQQAMQMAEHFAASQDKTVAQIYQEGGAPVRAMREAVQSVMGYPSGYLSSPLAKTLNVLVFPSRFDTKVGLAAAKYLGSKPPITQAAVLSSFLNANSFLKSPEGQKWTQDNAGAIKLLSYFSPLQTIGAVANFLGSKNPSDLGEIGGLPFGVVSTILEHQGILPASQSPDLATGKPYPQTIPTTDKAKAQQALTDFIGSVFSYPGKTAGLTYSKTQVVQAIPGLKPGTGETKTVGGTPKNSKIHSAPTGYTPSSSVKGELDFNKLPRISFSSKTKKAKIPKIKTVPASQQLPYH